LPFAVTGGAGCILMLIMLKRLTGIEIGKILSAPIDKELLKFSYPLMFVVILQTLMHWMDILMLGYFTDSTTVGLYHPAVRTAGLLQALLLSIGSIYSPILSQMHSQSETGKMSDLYRLVSRWLFTFAAPFALIMLLIPTKVMLLFGPDYISSSLVLVILTAATFSQTVLGSAGPILSMSGYVKLSLWNSLGAFMLNVALNIILIPRFGIFGAAWATMISLVVSGLARVIEVRIILNLTFLNRGFIKPALAGFISAAALWAIKPFIMPFHTLVTLAIAGSISLSLFALTMWLLKLEPEDRDFLKGLLILTKGIKK
ncbi:MAG TPA: oligosaccharide flippase family protein, partial [Candidatus Krumholzibacteriaceae bacterium]|nr:oligosaccharide flippase family protein [Candidatus Krumholzibacteriaceae bacterium]